MRSLLTFSVVLCVLSVDAGASSKGKAHNEILLLGDRRVSIAVPEGFAYSSGRDDQGVLMTKITDAKGRIDLQVRLELDPDSQLGGEAQQMEFLANTCRQYVESSVEKSFEFKALEPRHGSGTYCSFTDASLVHRAPYPKGEFLHVTTGVKVWSGCALVFTVLSNDIDSPEFQTALRLVKDSFEEIPVATPKV